MQIESILNGLRAERKKIDAAIAALEGLDKTNHRGPGRPTAATKTRRRGMSAAARRRMSAMMKLRWAERRKKAKA